MQRVYLDYAASTPVDARVLRAMEPYFTKHYGNPGALHAFGQQSMAVVDMARERIAQAIGAQFREVIFTGSATEANNLALRGMVSGAARPSKQKQKIIVSSIEHESILETAKDLEREGIEIVYLPVDAYGVVNLAALKKEINERTVLVSVMYANNETGAIQPIEEIARIVSHFRKETKSTFPLFHTDAVQAFQFFACRPYELGVDLMTLSSHKIYGPKGIGALYVSTSTAPHPHPLITGGGQEFGLRSGTENVPLIMGFAKSVELIVASRNTQRARLATLKKKLLTMIKKYVPDVILHSGSVSTLPHIVNVQIPGVLSETLLTALDLEGIAVSGGSACRSRSLTASHVLLAMGVPKHAALESIRISMGRPTTTDEIQRTVAALRSITRRYRK